MNSVVALTYWKSTEKVSYAEWSNNIPAPGLVINNGDQIAIRNIYVNTQSSPSSNVNILTDTEIIMEYAFYYMNSGFYNSYGYDTNIPSGQLPSELSLDISGTFGRYRQSTKKWDCREDLTTNGINWPQGPNSIVQYDVANPASVGYYQNNFFWTWNNLPNSDINPTYAGNGLDNVVNILSLNESDSRIPDITPYIVYYAEIPANVMTGIDLPYLKPSEERPRNINPCSINNSPDVRSQTNNILIGTQYTNPKVYKRELKFIIPKGSYSRSYLAEFITLQMQPTPLTANYLEYCPVGIGATFQSPYDIDNTFAGLNLNRNPFTLQINLMDWSYIPLTDPPSVFNNFGPLQPIIVDHDINGNNLWNDISGNINNTTNSLQKIPQLLPLCKITGILGINGTTYAPSIMPIIQTDNNLWDSVNNVTSKKFPEITATNYNQFNYSCPLIGATEAAFLYDQANNNVFSFTTHTPLLIDGKPSIVYLSQSNDPQFSQGVNNIGLFDKHSGVIFTKLEPVDFWTNLGFELNDIVLDPELYKVPTDPKLDTRYRGLITQEKFKNMSSGQVVGSSMIFNGDLTYGSFTQRTLYNYAIVTQANENTPPAAPISLSKLQVYQNPTLLFSSESRAWNGMNYIAYESDTVRQIVAPNPVISNTDAPGHYWVEIDGYNLSFFNEDRMLQVKTMVSSYFQSLSSYTTAPYIDSFLYSHKSNVPLVLSKLKVRIINPLTGQTESDVIVGPNSSVYLQITQNTKQFGLERDPTALETQFQLI